MGRRLRATLHRRLAEIKRWLELFVHRLFEISQFKRSVMPTAPK